MIHDVDETLRAVIRRDVLNGSNVEVSFEAPNTEWSSKRKSPTLNVYLYDIREDDDRRLSGMVERRDDAGHVNGRGVPPRRFKLSYLVTAWTQRPEDEHRLLSSVLGTFINADTLPLDLLQGALADSGEPVRATIGLPPPKDRSISDVWTALGGELKPSLDLVVTMPFVSQQEFHTGPPVTEQPRFNFAGPNGEEEQPRTRRRKGMVEEVAPPPLAAEDVRAGGEQDGRHFHMREVPRR